MQNIIFSLAAALLLSLFVGTIVKDSLEEVGHSILQTQVQHD